MAFDGIRHPRIQRRGKLSQAQRDQLIGVGQRMANWLYNTKQMSELPQRIRNEAERLQKEWDAVTR